MKTIFLTAAFALVLSTSFAQKLTPSEVPSAVTAKFATLYPNVSNVKWEKEHANYEAEFRLNASESTAVFDASGNLVQTETEVTEADLPAGITDYMKKNHPGSRIKEGTKITDASGKITWEIEAGEMDYLFDESGNFIKATDED